MPSATRPRRAVVTALIGGYERLVEQPVAAGSDVDLICFTDDPDLASDTWRTVLVRPLLCLDPVRSARSLKITGHPDLAAYDETLWVDARVRLEADPNLVLDEWLDGVDLAMPRHSFRADVVTEFEAVLLSGLDDFSRLYEQLTHYTVEAPDLLRRPVPWTALIARRRTESVDAAMQDWLLHVLRYSRRDQLSVVHSLARTGLHHRLVELDNHRSELHTWMTPVGRSTRPPALRISDSLRPPVAEIGELRLAVEAKEQEVEALRDAVAGRVHEHDRAVTALDERVAGLVAELERVAADQERERAAWRAQDQARTADNERLRALLAAKQDKLEAMRERLRVARQR